MIFHNYKLILFKNAYNNNHIPQTQVVNGDQYNIISLYIMGDICLLRNSLFCKRRSQKRFTAPTSTGMYVNVSFHIIT